MFCQVIIDILYDDYVYGIDFAFENEEFLSTFIIQINEGLYEAEFAKNLVFCQKIEEPEVNQTFLNFVLDEKEAIKIVQNFLNEYNNISFDILKEKYKVQLKYFNENIYYEGEEYYSD